MARRRLPLVLLGSLTLAIYFGYHASNGSHGLHARHALLARSSMLDRDIVRLEAVRARAKRDVALLAPEAPDPDAVAIIAADVLGYTRPGALILVPDR